jgi:hypothetical protein
VLLSNASLVALVAGTVERVAADGGFLGAAEVVAFAAATVGDGGDGKFALALLLTDTATP